MHLQAKRDKCLCSFVDIPVQGGGVRNIQSIRRMSTRVCGAALGLPFFRR